MARIKIEDIPSDQTISREDMKKVTGGLGDDAQLANIDMQNMLQKQQQTMQMMTSISKLIHDTSMVIIRKIG